MSNRPRRSSVWLINEEYIQLLPSLACVLGVDEALFLANLQRWIRTSRHEIDGQVWVYNKLPQWQEQLPFFPMRTLQRVIANLRDRGVITVTHEYNTNGSDRTGWYAINYQELDKQMGEWFEEQEPGDAILASHTKKAQTGDAILAQGDAILAYSIYKDTKDITTLGDGAAAPRPAPQAEADPLPPGGGVADSPSEAKTGGEKSAKPKLSDSPLIQAYRALHEKYPTTAQMKMIIEADPPLDNWVRAMRSWSGAGYRKVNVARQLEWALNPALIEEGKKPPAKHASLLAQPGDTYVPTPEEEEETRVWREKIDSKKSEAAYPED